MLRVKSSLFSKGFVDADSSVGIYTGSTLLGDLGIQHITLDNSGNQTVTWFANPPITKPFQDLRVGWITNCNVPIGCTQNQWLGVAGLEIDSDSGNTFPNLPDPFVKSADLTLNIGHAITYQEASNFDSFDEFNSVTCIDDTDGDITRSMTTVGSVDTSIAKAYTITYTCIDRASNQSTLDVQYIIKRQSTGKGTPPPSDGKTTLPPPLFTPAPPPTEVDRVFSIFDQLNSLFDFRPVTPEQVTPEPPSQPSQPTQPTPTPVPDQRDTFVDRIRDFFSSLFG